MSEPNIPKESALTETELPKETAMVEVSPETKALVEKKMPDESAEVQEKMMELIEAIKQQAQREVKATGKITRETYVQSMRKAQETLDKTGSFFEEQKNALEQSIADIESQATQQWDSFVKEVEEVGNRLDRAIHAAWEELTKPDTKA